MQQIENPNEALLALDANFNIANFTINKHQVWI